MKSDRTRAILQLLKDGREPELAKAVMRLFGASTIDECIATYEAIGAAESAGLDAAVKRVTEDANAAFSLRVDSRVS